MPLISRLGHVLAGGGGVQGSVNGTPYPFPTYGGGAWLTDEQTIVAGRDGKLHTFNVRTQEHEVLSYYAGNDIVAGGGRWLAWKSSGVYGSVALPDAPNPGLIAAGPDGTLVYVPDRQDGRSPVFLAPDGTSWNAPGAIVYDVQVFSPRSAMWTFQNVVYTHEYPRPATLTNVGRPRRAVINGEDWIVYWSEGTGLVAHPWTNPRAGFLIETRPLAFAHDAVGIDGQLRVVYSSTQGEAPQDIVTRTYTPDMPRVDLTALVGVAPFAQPLWSGYFYQWSNKYGDNASAPGNCTVVVEAGVASRVPTSQALIVSVDAFDISQAMWQARVPAVWVSGGNEDDLETAAAQARVVMQKFTGTKPVIGYLDKGRWGRGVKGIDIFGIQAYASVSESLSQFEQRVRDQITMLSPYGRLALHFQNYDTNDALTRDLVSLQSVFARLARYDAVVACLRFSDGRALPDGSRGGTRTHPELYSYHKAFDAAITQTPAIPNDVSVPAPAVTIMSYVAMARVGEAARAVAKLSGGPATTLQWLSRPVGRTEWSVRATNPADDLDHSFMFDAPGSYEIGVKVTGPGGTNQTGARRVIDVVAASGPAVPVPVPQPEDDDAPAPPAVPVPVPTTTTPRPRKVPKWWIFPRSWWP
jgi:hypothetical protein